MLDNAPDAPYGAVDALTDAIDVLTLWRSFVVVVAILVYVSGREG